MLLSKKNRIKKGNIFIPMIYSFSAKLDDSPTDSFFNNPTKIANNLRVLQNYFKTDGVVCTKDKLTLFDDLKKSVISITSKASKEVYESIESSINEIGIEGKTAVAIEVAKRLKVLMPDTIITGIMEGPIKLASMLTGLPYDNVIRNEEILSLTTKATLTFMRALGETGIDLLIIRENNWPIMNKTCLQMLTRCYSSLLNIASYYEFQAILMPEMLISNHIKVLPSVFQNIIFPAETDVKLLKDIERQSFSIPNTLLEKTPEEIEEYLFQSVIYTGLKSSNVFIITTDHEISKTVNREFMIRGVQTVQKFLKKEGRT